MDVTADGDRRPDFDNVGLVFKYLLGDVAKFLDGYFLHPLLFLDLFYNFFHCFAWTHPIIKNYQTIKIK